MTLELMHQVTKEQLARLHPLTRRELLAYFNNKLTPIINGADLITLDKTTEPQRLDAATLIAKSGRQFQKELSDLLAERKPDAPIGSERE